MRYSITWHYTLFFTLVATLTVCSQHGLNTTTVDVTRLPNKIAYEGMVKQAIGFTDKQGEHIVLTTETGVYQNNKFKHENDGSDAELFAYHYLVLKDSVKRMWKVYDYIKDCPVDIDAAFIKNTLQITDLNGDGIAEIWLMYKTACHGDVSPCDMKIIMYQNGEKFAMRGRNKVETTPGKFDGGEYTFDKNFNSGSVKYRDFAKKLWNEHMIQIW